MTDTQLIKDKIDIVDFIGEYVQLKSAGINHKGRCPFHQEKTPSFMVNRERQSWHCFGCSKGGDIFSFLQEIEGMDFIEALRFLADRAGIRLEFQASEINTSQKNRIKEINTEAARFFHNFLIKMSASKPAMDYLRKRGVKQETIEEWQIGFIPDQWELLTKYLLKKGFGIDDLVASGLTIKKEGADTESQKGFYDRFRGRIMFPIWDVHGGVVGFTGRVLVETEKSGGNPVSNKFAPGKYVNTPQTIVYDKSRVVFGLDKAKQEIKAKDLIVMVEGQMDVIACHQAGQKNVVATSGTALTEQQINLLKRYSKNISMAFDGDAAGQAAIQRGINLALENGLNVNVIQIPDGCGKDPDECLKQNPQVWFKTVVNAKEVMVWHFDRVFAGKNVSDLRQRQAIIDELQAIISLIPYPVTRDYWQMQLSEKTGVDISILRENMKQIMSKNKKKEYAVKGFEIAAPKVIIEETTRLGRLLERFFMLFFRLPVVLQARINDLDAEILSLPAGRQAHTLYYALYENVKMQYNSNNLIDISKLRESIVLNEVCPAQPKLVRRSRNEDGGGDGDTRENLIDLLLMKGELEFSSFLESELEQEMKNILEQLAGEWRKTKRKQIQSDIEQAGKENNFEKQKKLMEDLQKLAN